MTKKTYIPLSPGLSSVAILTRLQKLWFLMDMPINKLRDAIISNPAYFTDQDVAFSTMFFVKLDMYWTHSTFYTCAEATMRRWLLGERSFTTLWNYLRKVEGTTHAENLRLFVRYKYQRREGASAPTSATPWPEQTLALQSRGSMRPQPLFGVPPQLVGKAGWEYYGYGHQRLRQLPGLVSLENVKRGLNLQTQLFRYMVWGHRDPATWMTLPNPRPEDVVPTYLLRREKELVARLERNRLLRRLELNQHTHDAVKTGECSCNEGQAGASTEDNADGDAHMEDVVDHPAHLE